MPQRELCYVIWIKFYRPSKSTAFSCPALYFCASHSSLDLLERLYEDSVLLELFRSSTLSPIHKKGPKSTPENFRSVSKCTIACLVLEKILASHPSRFLAQNPLNHSCTHGEDLVNHNSLFDTRQPFCNRTFRVKVDDELSPCRPFHQESHNGAIFRHLCSPSSSGTLASTSLPVSSTCLSEMTLRRPGSRLRRSPCPAIRRRLYISLVRISEGKSHPGIYPQI